MAVAPIRLQDSEVVHLYGEADPGTVIGLCDGTELTVDISATSLELPVVGGDSAFARAIGQ